MNKLARLTVFCAFFIAGAAQAAQVQFAGNLVFIINNGGSIFSGSNSGTPFSGQFTYGDSASEATFTEIDIEESNFGFVGAPFNASLNGGSSVPTNDQLRLDIENDGVLDVIGVSLFTGLFGASANFVANALFDNWNINAWPAGAVVDPPGNTDPDDDFFSGGGVFFSIDVTSFNSNLYSGTDFQQFPPGLGDPVYGRFRVVERAADGSLLFDGTGALTSLTNVPLPPVVWLFLSGLFGFIPAAKRVLNSSE